MRRKKTENITVHLHKHNRYEEICKGEEVLFRGGYFANGGSPSNYVLLDENGDLYGLSIVAVQSDGTGTYREGNSADRMAPSPSVILQMVNGPELTSRGKWYVWFFGAVISVLAAVWMLFADELFRNDLAIRIRNADQAEPSEWEIVCRYIQWTGWAGVAFALYIMGLQLP